LSTENTKGKTISYENRVNNK